MAGNDALEVAVVRTGIANVASMLVSLERAGARARVTSDAADVERARLVVLPGVGSFGAGMQSLRASGVDRALVARISAGMPTLCVCLGLQLLFEESDESPGVRGLGLVSGRVARFGRDVRVPQMGWNAVDVTARDGEPSSNMLERGAAFFANSYRVARAPEGWRCAMSEHGGRFVAAMERGGVLACQFHPELSGTYGQRLVSRWIASASASAEAAPC